MLWFELFCALGFGLTSLTFGIIDLKWCLKVRCKGYKKSLLGGAYCTIIGGSIVAILLAGLF